MKEKSAFARMLANRFVLNMVFILSILTNIGYIIIGDIRSVATFVLLALIIVNFSKNMIVVLGLPMIFVSLIYVFRKQMLKEGMENNESTAEEDNEEEPKKEKRTEKISNDVVKTGDGSVSMTAVNAETKIKNGKDNKATTDESFEVGRNKKNQYNIDYASTIEDAYDELNKILGSDGIKNLTEDTQKLMKQQMMLAESMQSMEPIIKGMGPLLEKAEGLLGNMGGATANLDSFKKMAEKFTTKK